MWLLLQGLVDHGDFGDWSWRILGFGYRNRCLEHVIPLEFFSIFKIHGQVSI